MNKDIRVINIVIIGDTCTGYNNYELFVFGRYWKPEVCMGHPGIDNIVKSSYVVMK